MNLVDEQHVPGFQVRQHRREVSGLGDDRPRSHAEVHAKFAADDLGQRRLAKAGRAVEQQVIHGLATSPCRFDEDGKVRSRLGLSG